MSTRLASVGDTIRITSTAGNNTAGNNFGKVFTVIKAPEGYYVSDTMTWVWIVNDDGLNYRHIFYPGDYEIIDPESQPQDVKDVDESLATQMDDNLRSIFS